MNSDLVENEIMDCKNMYSMIVRKKAAKFPGFLIT